MTINIDLEAEYGVVMGSFGQPPYTPEQYLQAENNRLGLQAAIDYAFAEGATRVEFAKFHVTLGYKYSSNSGLAGSGDTLLFMRSNTVYDFAESKIEVMFDSDTKSPYHTSTRRPDPYQLNGKVIGLNSIRNSSINNLEIEGDVYKRSWTNEEENAEEQTKGIHDQQNCFNITIQNCRIHGFMGDSVSGGDAFKWAAAEFSVYTKGFYNSSDGTIDTSIPGAYISNMVTLNEANLNDPNNFNSTLLQLRVSNGSFKVMRFPSELLDIIWLDENDVYIRRSVVYATEYIIRPINAKKARLQIYNVPGDAETWEYPELYKPNLTMANSRGMVLSKCEFYNNHRGGVSNLSDDFVIDNCLFLNNGLDSSIGAPQFPDTTRYQIDIENVYSTGCKITNNRFVNSFNGVLMSSFNAVIENNKFINSGGIGLFGRCLDATVRGNRIYGTGSYGLVVQPFNAIGLTEHRRRYLIENNIIVKESLAFGISPANTQNTDIIFKNNIITTSEISVYQLEPTSYFEFSGNYITLTGRINSTNGIVASSSISGVNRFFDNTFETKNYGRDIINPVMHLNGIIKGARNTLKNMTIGLQGYTWGSSTDKSVTGITFDNCMFMLLTRYNSPLITHEYIDCEFINTEPQFADVNTNNLEGIVINKYTRCVFHKTNEVQAVINSRYALVQQGNQQRRLIMDNCKIISNQEMPVTLIVGSSSLNLNQRVSVQINDMILEGSATDGLENRIFFGNSELKE